MRKKQLLLDRHIQSLIERHGASNPELKAGLEELRKDLHRTDGADVALVALRLAGWVRWIYDLLP
jgi:hypothetical protein